MIDMTSVSFRFVLARISDPQTAKCDFYWSSGMDETTLFKFGNSQIMAKVYTPCAPLSDTANLTPRPTVRHSKVSKPVDKIVIIGHFIFFIALVVVSFI